MKKCELCSSVARMYCDSDQASLCWDCDSRVHTANFLVTKHTRTLLCHACQSLTPWTGSGPRLGPTVSVCPSCLADDNSTNRNRNITEDAAGGDDDHEEEEDDDDEDDEDDGEEDEDEDEEDDDGENQVVPLSLPPSFASSSSSTGESSDTRDRAVSGSSFGSFDPTTSSVESTRFSYSSLERPEEKKKGTDEKIRPWTWR